MEDAKSTENIVFCLPTSPKGTILGYPNKEIDTGTIYRAYSDFISFTMCVRVPVTSSHVWIYVTYHNDHDMELFHHC